MNNTMGDMAGNSMRRQHAEALNIDSRVVRMFEATNKILAEQLAMIKEQDIRIQRLEKEMK